MVPGARPRLVRVTPPARARDASGVAPLPTHDAALDTALHVALDEVMLDLARPAARVWTPEGRAVVIGVASRAADEVNLDECRASGVPVCRRFSGGASVLLSPEVVCFSLILPYAEYDEAGTIGGAYRIATSAVAEALREIGVEPVFEPPGDLAVKGRKIAGFAQARRRTAAMVHGAVPVSLDGAELDRFLGPPAEEPTYRRGRQHSEFVTDLGRELGGCEVADVEAALTRALMRTLAGTDAEAEDFTHEEIERARRLLREKYGTDEWTFRR